MFTSEDKSRSKHLAKCVFVYLLLSLLTAVFGAVYEHFSHGVYSPFMLYAFFFPLILGAVLFCALSLSASCHLPNRLCFNLYNSGVATLTVGSLFQGVLEIYGTTNTLTAAYWLFGLAFTAAGLLLYLAQLFGRDKA